MTNDGYRAAIDTFGIFKEMYLLGQKSEIAVMEFTKTMSDVSARNDHFNK
jgi:hypothetical protein